MVLPIFKEHIPNLSLKKKLMLQVKKKKKKGKENNMSPGFDKRQKATVRRKSVRRSP